jgi:type VI secretion system protein VasG
LTNTLLAQISEMLLTVSLNDQRYRQLHIALNRNEFTYPFEA